MISTICRDCVFAQWKGNKQSGCDFNRLEKFEDQGTHVKLEEGKGKVYARIEGRVCNTCRHPSALEKIHARKWMIHVRKEIVPPIAMAVYTDGNTDSVDTFTSLHSILKQTIPPSEIILIYNNEGRDAPSEYSLWFDMHCNDIPWRIQTIKGVAIPLQDELMPADYGDAIDLTVQSAEMKAVYFTCCRAGYEYPMNYIEVIDEAINEKLLRFVALFPDDEGNGLFVQRKLYNFLGGNKKVSIIDKIWEIAREEGTGYMIKTFEELLE